MIIKTIKKEEVEQPEEKHNNKFTCNCQSDNELGVFMVMHFLLLLFFFFCCGFAAVVHSTGVKSIYIYT